jgi:hypothetical protein
MRFLMQPIGLVLGAIMFAQLVLGGALSALTEGSGFGRSAAAGLFMAMLWLIASLLVSGVPLVSVGAFALAGILAFAAATTQLDLRIWGAVSFVLAALSLRAWFELRAWYKEHAEFLAEAEEIRTILSEHAARDASPILIHLPSGLTAGTPCPSCGYLNYPGSRACAECGKSLTARPRQTRRKKPKPGRL